MLGLAPAEVRQVMKLLTEPLRLLLGLAKMMERDAVLGQEHDIER